MSAKKSTKKKGRSTQQKYQRGSRPGLSVLAEGEPMIWLSGGALGFALLMIVGLLGLIVYQGMATFWPGRIYRVQLTDGTVLMGEIVQEETYSLSSDSDQPDQGRRWQYRTDNFEFQDASGGMYRWVTEQEIAAEPTQPEWAVLLERTSLGRFFGIPTRFVTTEARAISAEEEELVEIRRFFTVNRTATEPEDPAQAEAWQAALEELDQALAQVQQEIDEVEAENSALFLDQFQADNDQWLAVLEEDQVVPLAERQPHQNVVAVRQVIEGSQPSWQAFNEHHPTARERTHQADQIAEHEVGQSSSRQEEMRLALREQEIRHDLFLESLANEIYTLRVERDAIQAETEADTRTVDQAIQLLGEDSPLASLGPTMLESLETQRAQRIGEIDDRLQEIDTLLDAVPPAARQAVADYVEVRFEVDQTVTQLQNRIREIQQRNDRRTLIVETAQGVEAEMKLGQIVRAFPANQLGTLGRLGVYASRWGEFLTEDPREANSEGGVFPAIWGTVAMTMIMSLIVVPFGVLAALYLREYAKSGPIVSIIRISINNLAGVPSIVFGVFGYGFLILVLGSYIDGGPRNANLPILPEPWWWFTAAGLAVLAFAAFLTTIWALGSRKQRATRGRSYLGTVSVVLWIAATAAFVLLVAFNPYFQGLFRAGLPNPTFGKGALIWASLTLALLTLPVVIVATEEALAAVPNSLREGSYGCGASKWQTIRRIILPHALPGIMTGMILAMARGAGEVAPLMLVGVLKLAPELPIDTTAPFVHLDRSFMHLGFHIFDLGFQSPNSEAAKPMVFTTTLLLIALIGLLNMFAIWLRATLRRRFQSGQF